MYNTNNGGTIGDGHGRYKNPNTHYKYYVHTGTYLFFSNNRTKSTSDFVLGINYTL